MKQSLSSISRLAFAAAIFTTAAVSSAQVSLSGHYNTGKGMDVPFGTRYAEKQFVVAFKPGVNARTIDQMSRQFGLTINRSVSNNFFKVLTIPQNSQMKVEGLVRAFRQYSIVDYAEVDPVITPDFVPNDPRVGDLWGFNNTGQFGGTVDADCDVFEAWDTIQNHPEIIVAVCDDGFETSHEDLDGQFYINPNDPVNGVDDDNNGFIDDYRGWDFSSGDNDVNPQNGDSHGTHVMGTVAAAFNNGKGVAGVGPNIKVMPLRMYGGPAPFMSALAASVDYAWQNGASVISVSYNIDGYTNALLQAVQRAGTADVVYSNSAGNNGQQNPPRQNMIDESNNVIFVAANTHNDVLTWFSNYGSKVQISAPGENIWSTVVGNTYASYDGTSMSTPMFSAMVAVVRSLNPTMSAREALDHMIDTADVVPGLNGQVVGNKRANLNASVLGVPSGPGGAPISITPVIGVYMGGDVNAVSTSDDNYYLLASSMLGTRGMYAAYDLAFSVNANPTNLSQLTFSMEAKSSGPTTTLAIMFFNFRTNAWDRARSGRLTAVDQEFEAVAGANRADYVAANGSVYVRVEAFQALQRTSRGTPTAFHFNTDMVSIRAQTQN